MKNKLESVLNKYFNTCPFVEIVIANVLITIFLLQVFVIGLFIYNSGLCVDPSEEGRRVGRIIFACLPILFIVLNIANYFLNKLIRKIFKIKEKTVAEQKLPIWAKTGMVFITVIFIIVLLCVVPDIWVFIISLWL